MSVGFESTEKLATPSDASHWLAMSKSLSLIVIEIFIAKFYIRIKAKARDLLQNWLDKKLSYVSNLG